MFVKNGVLEGSGLDFKGPGARFWRVLGSFFRDLGPLGETNAVTDFDLEAKAAQFQLGTRVARSSYFYVEVRPRSSTSKSGRDLLKRVGGGDPPGVSICRPPKVCTACWTSPQIFKTFYLEGQVSVMPSEIFWLPLSIISPLGLGMTGIRSQKNGKRSLFRVLGRFFRPSKRASKLPSKKH